MPCSLRSLNVILNVTRPAGLSCLCVTHFFKVIKVNTLTSLTVLGAPFLLVFECESPVETIKQIDIEWINFSTYTVASLSLASVDCCVFFRFGFIELNLTTAVFLPEKECGFVHAVCTCVCDVLITDDESLTFVDVDQNQHKQQQHNYTDDHSSY